MSDPCGEPIILDGQEFHCDNMATDSQDGLVWRCWWCHRREQERSILTDLITELRAEHYPHPCTDPEDFPCCCESCAGAWPCLMADMADRAEARLREMTGDE